jgi:hypothetical protein
MKRIICILSLLVSPFLVGAQDLVDDLFIKYSGNNNCTSITISKDILDFAFTMNKDRDKLKGKITDLKILISEHHDFDNSEFTNEIKDKLQKNNYISLMEILNGSDKVNLYVKKDNDKIIHLLLLAIEHNEEVFLSLKGSFTVKELAEIGRNADCNGSLSNLSYLKCLDK